MNGNGPTLDDAALADGSALEDALARSIDARAVGMALRAPARVLIGGDGRLPLVGCRVVTLREATRRPAFEEIAVLVASSIETGQVYAARAFAPSAEGIDPAPAPPDPGEGHTGMSFRIDAAARLGLPLEAGSYALWLIARGDASQSARVEVAKPAPPPIEDPEVLKFIAEWRARHARKPRGADPSTVWPPEAVFGSYPRYRAGAESPPLPQRGIALWTKRVVLLEDNARWVLAGSFRLAVARRHVVLERVSGDTATAIVPISLLVNSNEIAEPVVRQLRVPSTTPIAPSEDFPLVEGHFTLNLFSLPRMRRAPGGYFIRAVCGEELSEAAVSALVTEAMLAANV